MNNTKKLSDCLILDELSTAVRRSMKPTGILLPVLIA